MPTRQIVEFSSDAIAKLSGKGEGFARSDALKLCTFHRGDDAHSSNSNPKPVEEAVLSDGPGTARRQIFGELVMEIKKASSAVSMLGSDSTSTTISRQPTVVSVVK